MRSRTRMILLGVAVLAVAAGVAVAVASFHDTSDHASSSPAASASAASQSGGDLAAAAAYLGLTRAELRSRLARGQNLAQIAAGTSGRSEAGLVAALVAARTAALAAQVAKGKISHQVARRRRATLHTKVAATVHRARFGPPLPEQLAAARYLGIPAAQLRRELRSGRTPAQVAAAIPGRSASGLVTAILAAHRRRLDAAVAAGRISRTRESRVLARLQARVNAAVAGTPAAGA